MDPVQAVKSVLGQYANFKGRARRSEFWWWFLFVVVVSAVASGLDALLFSVRVDGFGFFRIIVSLAVIVPSLAVAWRRLHDTDHSGGWYFIQLIPLVGTIIYLIFVCTDSQPQPNRFGPSPKQPAFGYGDGPAFPPPAQAF